MLTGVRSLVALLWHRWRGDAPAPADVLLVLGGDRRRELMAARRLAHTTARVLVLSSGAATERELIEAAGAGAVVIVDHSAVDTVTNFTMLAAPLAATGVRGVAIATARAHTRRATAVRTVVLGACGLELETHSVDSGEALQESLWRTARDVMRAMLWALSGWDGSTVANLVHQRRRADAESWRSANAEADARLRAKLAEALALRAASGASGS